MILCMKIVFMFAHSKINEVIFLFENMSNQVFCFNRLPLYFIFLSELFILIININISQILQLIDCSVQVYLLFFTFTKT